MISPEYLDQLAALIQSPAAHAALASIAGAIWRVEALHKKVDRQGKRLRALERLHPELDRDAEPALAHK